MTSNVKMILDEVNARIKLAEAKTAEDPSNFDSFPGAENDKPVPDETKKPDPEVKEEGPASRTEVTGAEPGSDVPLQQDHLYEADEPVLTPEKKPAESDDANAKEASADPDVTKVASDILGIIRNAMAKKAAAPAEKKEAPAEKKAAAPAEKKAAAPAEKKEAPAEKQAAAPAEKKEAPAEKKAEPVSKTTKPEKKAENNMISLEQKILDKIASVRMAKQAGAADAATLMKAASDYNRGAQDAIALLTKLAQDAAAAEEAGAADAEAGIADAAAAAAAEDAGDAGAAAEDAGGIDEEVTPEEVAQAVGELVQEGQISEEDAAGLIGQLGGEGGGEGDVSEDDIAEGIAQAIESGELSEDEAQQLVQELVNAGADESVAEQVADGGDAGAAAEDAGAAAEDAGAADAEAALADAAATDEAQKTAEAHQQMQVSRYQKGFIQKCAEYGVDPQRLAQYIQARTGTAR